MTLEASSRDASQIAINIAARKDAEEMIAFIGEKPARFWEVLAEHCAKQLPAKPEQVDPLPAMNEAEAIRFEATHFPYGKHFGELIGTVDCGYVLFLTEGDAFSRNLRRYVKSDRFQRRQDEQ
jgi:hypothetical protein